MSVVDGNKVVRVRDKFGKRYETKGSLDEYSKAQGGLKFVEMVQPQTTSIIWLPFDIEPDALSKGLRLTFGQGWKPQLVLELQKAL